MRPSGLNATPLTGAMWPVQHGDVGVARDVPQHHGRVDAAGGDGAAVGAERDIQDLVTVPGERVWEPSARLHSVRVLSATRGGCASDRVAVATVLPSGLNATALTKVSPINVVSRVRRPACHSVV